MESFKKFGAFFQDHYEKIILSIILLVLLGFAGLLPLRVSQNRQMIEDIKRRQDTAPRSPRKPVDLDAYRQVLDRARQPAALDLVGEHNLFNPQVWKRFPNGDLRPVPRDQEGPGGLELVEAPRPLQLRITFDGVQGSGDSMRYQFGVIDETKSKRGPPRKTTRLLTLNAPAGKNDLFSLQKVNGPPDNPDSVEIQFTEGRELATITKTQPYARTEMFEADLKHEAMGGKRFNNVRPKEKLSLGGKSYNIVAITKDAVTVESTDTYKRWTIRLPGAP